MKRVWINVIAIAVFAVFILVGLVVATLIHLKGASFWILAGAFAALGLIAAGALLWWWYSQPGAANPQEGAARPSGGQTVEKEIDFLVRQAESRLRSSRLGRGSKIGKLPVIFLAGAQGSGKTAAVLESGLEPELLAGQVSQDGKIAPTHTANLWFTRQAVIAEAAGGLLTQPAAWARLVRRVAPSGFSSILSRKGPAPRAAIVCLSLESFLRSGGAEGNASALQSLRTNLDECSRRLGVSLPLYVLFTKLDQAPFFAEYVENFVTEEATQVFGATLSVRRNAAAGTYAEEESKRLGAAFDELFNGLSDGRLEVLGREHKAERLPGAYEFPREFRKLRGPLVQFLLDLCRPSQLNTSPFLRGFYFSGRRTVLVEDAAAADVTHPGVAPVEEDLGATRVISSAQMRQIAAQRSAAPGSGATHVFDLRGMAAGGAAGRTKTAQQPVFLCRLFSDILLKDRAGLAARGSSSKVNLWRRLLLGAAAVTCLVFSTGFAVSFMNNRALESQVNHATQASEANPPNAALASQLQQLEALRKPLAQISNYNRNGAPLRYGWWLYAGHKLYPAACSAYSQKLHQSILTSTQSSIVSQLRGLPSAPSGDYGAAYDALKAYLITTTHPGKSEPAFLTPELFGIWPSSQGIDPATGQLARAQLDFYGNELKNSLQLGDADCFASPADHDAVAHARAYLNLFPPEERVYKAMLADASKSAPPLIYARLYPNAAGVVSNPYEVPGAFTKEGLAVMEKDLNNAGDFLKGEPWVLGTQVSGTTDIITLQQHLRQRYQSDFANAWRQFLASAKVVPYRDLKDASAKLQTLAGNTSPLLELFLLASNNVHGSPAEPEFQPVVKVVPPSPQNQYFGPSNQQYMTQLINLQAAVSQLAAQPQAVLGQGAPNPVTQPAQQATTTAETLAQGFTPDPAGHVDSMVRRLLLEPITLVNAAMPKPGAALNGQGRALCAQLRPLFGQYPFGSNPHHPANPQQFIAIFQPNGTLSSFYTQNLASVLTFAGSGYVANLSSPVKINPIFLGFFNRAMALQRAMYPNGAGQPQLHFSLTPIPPQGVKQFSVTIDGQTMAYPGGAVQITWSPLTASDTKKLVDGGSVDYAGTWGLFSLFREAAWKSNGSGFDLTWVQKSGDQILRLPNGQPETSGVHLDMLGAPPIFEPGYLSRLGCVAQVAE